MGENHTLLAQLRDLYDSAGEKKDRPLPSTGVVLGLVIADMIASPDEPTRIYKFEQLAEDWQTDPALGICPTLLNDDRILRALTSLGESKDRMDGFLHALTVETCNRYEIPLDRFYVDTKVLELSGDFNDCEIS